MTDDPQVAASRRDVLSAVLLATLIGAVVRGVHVLLADFPLNDGALFLVMTRDLVANGFAPPAMTTYNGGEIPFAYPPLGFYLAGLASLTGLDLFTVFRIVPFLISLATIPAAFLFASVALPTRFAALLATVAFALIPRGFEWLIAGGGVTRGLGVLFAILVLWAALCLERDRTGRRAVILGVLSGLAALSHPEAVIVAGFWLLAVLLTTERRTELLRWFLTAAAIAAVIVLPWLLLTISRHGIDAILGAGRSGFDPSASVQYLLSFDLTDEPFITLIAVLALVGLMIRSRLGDWRWLIWVGVVVVDARGGTTYVAPILGALAAIALTDSILPTLSSRRPGRNVVWPDGSISRAGRIALALMLGIGAIGAIGARTGEFSPLHGLPGETRAAVDLVRSATPPDAQVIVVSGEGWWLDAVAEWFPVLAERGSPATVQGAEWLGPEGWTKSLDAHQALQTCAFASVTCFEEWRIEHAPDADFVLLPRGHRSASPLESECCPALRAPLVVAGYPVVFDEPGGTLLALP